jgi:DNA replication protein DnaC
MSTATRTGTCECGATVVGEIATGYLADLLNKLKLVCDDCTAAAASARADSERRAEEQRHRNQVATALEALPSALRSVQLDELDVAGRERALEAAGRWATRDLLGLVLLGPFGVGKTMLAAGAVRRHIEHDPITPRWLSAPLILNHLARDFKNPLRDAMIDSLGNRTRTLILDDLDKVRPTVFAAESLFLAIDQSLTEQRSLLVTTNWMPSEFAKQWPTPWGDAIASRLVGYCELHRLTGQDRRLHQ